MNKQDATSYCKSCSELWACASKGPSYNGGDSDILALQQCQALLHATIFQGAKVIFAGLGLLVTISLRPTPQEQLGGRCKLTLMAKILFTAPDMQFSQPEVNIRTTTGSSSSQQLVCTIGKFCMLVDIPLFEVFF